MPKKNRLVGWWPIQEVVVLALILIVSISGAAQLPTGTILGVVKDTNGGIVPGTAVTVRNTVNDAVVWIRRTWFSFFSNFSTTPSRSMG